MKTLESIFSEIKENGVITKQQLQLLKNRSNKFSKGSMMPETVGLETSYLSTTLTKWNIFQ